MYVALPQCQRQPPIWICAGLLGYDWGPVEVRRESSTVKGYLDFQIVRLGGIIHEPELLGLRWGGLDSSITANMQDSPRSRAS